VPSEASKQVEVTSAQARVLDGASPSAPESFTAGKGQKLYVLDRANDYYAVASDHGATGWVTVGDVKPLFKMGTYTPWVYDDFKGMKVVSAQNGTGTSGAASNSGFPEAPSSTADQGGLFVFLTQRAVEFRDEYKNNPYV
jgi:hypothetical protein